MRTLALIPVLCLATSAAAGYDLRGIALGAKESDIRRELPSAHCKALEWESRAADRRCDDSRVALAGIEVKVTFYLKKDAVEAFDVRFDTKDLDRLLEFLKSRYGAPRSEHRDTIDRKDRGARRIYKALWERGAERAVLVAQLEKRRGSMLVQRGDFEEEIYRVR